MATQDSSLTYPLMGDRGPRLSLDAGSMTSTAELWRAGSCGLPGPRHAHNWNRRVAVKEAKRILRRSVVMCALGTCEQLAELAIASTVGRMDTVQLSALGLGSALFGVTGLSIVEGVATGLDTLCGQAYGAQEYQLLGILVQRGMLISLLTAVGPAIGWTWAEPLLLSLGQNPEVAAVAARYVQNLRPALFLHAVSQCLDRYLAAQGVVAPLMVPTIVWVLGMPAIALSFLRQGWGTPGIAVANNIMSGVNVLVMVCVTTWWVRRAGVGQKPWAGWTWAALRQWWPYLKIALPSAGSLALTWWLYEVLSPLAGTLRDGVEQQAAVESTLGLCMLMWMLICGVGETATIRIANHLGAGHVHQAQLATVLSLLISLVASIASAAAVFSARHMWARLFSNDKLVQDIVVASMPYMAVHIVMCAIAEVLRGVISGCGRQIFTLWVVIVEYWVFGLPLLIWLGKSHGVPGMWLALLSIAISEVVVFGIWVARLDWVAAAQRVREELVAHGEALELDSDEEAGTSQYPSLPNSPGWHSATGAKKEGQTGGYPSLPNSPGWHSTTGAKAGHTTPVYLPVTPEGQESEKEELQPQHQEEQPGMQQRSGQGQQRIADSQTGKMEQSSAGLDEEGPEGQKQQQQDAGQQTGKRDGQQVGKQKKQLRLRQGEYRHGSDDSQGSDSPFASMAHKPFGQDPS